MNAYNFNDFENGTTFAAENSSETSTKRELTPFQKGVVAVAAVGVAGAAVGAGLYWANRGIRETAKNVSDAATAVHDAHERHLERKAKKDAIEAALNQNA